MQTLKEYVCVCVCKRNYMEAFISFYFLIRTGTAKVDEDHVPRRAQDESWACHCDDSAG
jgi:hypothetical protein